MLYYNYNIHNIIVFKYIVGERDGGCHRFVEDMCKMNDFDILFYTNYYFINDKFKFTIHLFPPLII